MLEKNGDQLKIIDLKWEVLSEPVTFSGIAQLENDRNQFNWFEILP